ncbi:sensor histidine kinase [Halorubrum sp. GN11_10-6_MGM]|uniref:sensor histidine kinase n=1 Tax=Halorubrum sp. GN11_10-6_MGM TaxID=2518112 RepID=UPI0010F8D8AC|nr:PAS domain-containing sensor histidine kinase [Halorubrum sp. GN11_10-6_MGM]TKX74241.1 sensor histidine kinase [Halorubrum sp. GN11_10-6_MGM]
MSRQLERRPGVAYRRPGGDPDRFVVEAAGESRLDLSDCSDGGWLDRVASADRDRLREALEAPAVDVVYRVAADGEPRWVHERGRTTDGGDVVGYLFLAGERVERRRQLERQRERLDEFASVVSHDLRNPLSVAVGNVELAEQLAGDASAERMDRALDALDRMDELIGDLLTLAREGKTVDTAEPTDLRPVVERAWRTAGESADAALAIDGPLGTTRCDPERMRQALENLFRNAIEHGTTDDAPTTPDASATPDDAPTTPDASATPDDAAVRVRVGRTDEGLYVADDGPGIDPDQRDAVFEPGHTTAPDGTGFGLAIVERIAAAHGWSVSVTESREGGARFEFVYDESIDAPETSGPDTGPHSTRLRGRGSQ